MNVVLYFQVHQPFRLRPLTLFDIGSLDSPFDDELNRSVMERVARRCYLPANALLRDAIGRYGPDFKVALSLTGTAVEQLELYAPEAFDSFARLIATGRVELLGETYYHSLSYLYDAGEFSAQVEKHRRTMRSCFGRDPVTFRNTELIYEDRLTDRLRRFRNFRVVMAEGADRIMPAQPPLVVRRSYAGCFRLLLRSFRLSADIAFRFTDRNCAFYPLTADRFLSWLRPLTCAPAERGNRYLGLFMDYETLGEHHRAESGIFPFFEELFRSIVEEQGLRLAWPSDVLADPPDSLETMSVPEPISWADAEKDLSAWLANDLQRNASDALYALLAKARGRGDRAMMDVLRKLSASDHFYYMHDRSAWEGDAHRYFSPFDGPEEAYRSYLFALADLEERL